MSLADDKRSVFTTIGAYKSLMESSDANALRQSNLFTSINNKDDIVPYLLDVLKVTAGTEALKETIGGMFTKLISDIEPTLKTALKKQFILSNSSSQLPTTPHNFVDDGITVPVKQIDVKGKFKIAPDSATGNLIYGSNINFDTVSYDAILNSGNPQIFSNMSITYLEGSDSFQIKPELGGTSPNIGDYFSDYIDSVDLIDKKNIVSDVMNAMYGTLTSEEDKTVEEVYEELQIEQMLQQVLNDDDSFVITPDKYDELLSKAQELVAGELNYDMGCGLMATELLFDDFDNFISNVTGSTDPFYVGNQFAATIDQSTSGDTATQDMADENKETIRDGFFQRIINVFTVKLLEAVTTAPQIRTLFGMMSALQNDGVVMLDKATEDMKNFKTTIKCMAKEIMKAVAEFIFLLALSYLIALITPVIKEALKEKINQYVRTIKSLTAASKFLN